jgi:hypothetical protein
MQCNVCKQRTQICPSLRKRDQVSHPQTTEGQQHENRSLSTLYDCQDWHNKKCRRVKKIHFCETRLNAPSDVRGDRTKCSVRCGTDQQQPYCTAELLQQCNEKRLLQDNWQRKATRGSYRNCTSTTRCWLKCTQQRRTNIPCLCRHRARTNTAGRTVTHSTQKTASFVLRDFKRVICCIVVLCTVVLEEMGF